MNFLNVALSVSIFTTSFAAVANDADIFNSIKIGGTFDAICGSSSEYCEKYEDFFTNLFASTDLTYLYTKENNEKILLMFDCFGYLYEKSVESKEFGEPLSELIQDSVGEYLKNEGFNLVSKDDVSGEVWSNGGVRVHLSNESVFVSDYEGPYKRLNKFEEKKHIKFAIPFARFSFDVNNDCFKEIKGAMKCKEINEDIVRCSAPGHGFHVYLQEGVNPFIRILPDPYNPNIKEFIEFKDKLLSANPDLRPVDGEFAIYGNKSLGYVSITNKDESNVIEIVPSKYVANKRFWESKLSQKQNNKPDFLSLD